MRTTSAFLDDATRASLLHDLAGGSGEQVLMSTVDFPPGFSSPVHRQNAQVSVYVLEGSVVIRVRGVKEITLGPGQSFYEAPNDIHVVGAERK